MGRLTGSRIRTVEGPDRHGAFAIQGIARVYRKIDDDLFELTLVDLDRHRSRA